MERIAIIGAGSWGGTLSLLLAKKGYLVSLWVWDSDQADVMRRTGENPFVPGFPLPDNITITTSMSDAALGAEVVLFVSPSHSVVSVSNELKKYLPAGVPVISATKGLNGETGLTISQTLSMILSGVNPIAVLSGPNLAPEVAKGIPTATVIACRDDSIAHQAQNLLMSPSLRVYTNRDVIGVELAGALKNVIAIASGICDGMGLGDNTKAALLTRGLAEITRLGVKMGAQQATFMGLAGVGDLIVTCSSPLSRNHRVGIGLGKGMKLDDVVREIGQTAEGIPTTRAAYNLARQYDTPMPITEQVYQVLFEGKSPQAAVSDLMSREPKDEVW